eukprot:1158835-Pelagomonas_calceolata.AAC.19
MCASLLQGLTCLSTGQKSYIRSAAERYQRQMARQPCIKELQETMLLQSSHLSVTLGNDHQRNIHNDGTPFSSDAVTASRANKPVYRACMSSW